MRKITEESIKAFENNEYFNKQNMMVRSDGTMTEMLLHGNMIARKHFKDGKWLTFITNAGWQSNTTKERLNGIEGVNIYQKDYQWYLNGRAWHGEMTCLEVWNMLIEKEAK